MELNNHQQRLLLCYGCLASASDDVLTVVLHIHFDDSIQPGLVMLSFQISSPNIPQMNAYAWRFSTRNTVTKEDV